jgi:hypothetical protein
MKFISYAHRGIPSWGLITPTGVIRLATPEVPRAVPTAPRWLTSNSCR